MTEARKIPTVEDAGLISSLIGLVAKHSVLTFPASFSELSERGRFHCKGRRSGIANWAFSQSCEPASLRLSLFSLFYNSREIFLLSVQKIDRSESRHCP